MDLIFLDTETTGVDSSKDRLCQVCYKTDSGIYTEYFKPPIPMSVKSMSITHITDKMLEDKPPFEGSQMKRDLQFLLQSGILVAHNAKFDISMLKAEGMDVARHICTLRVARHLDEEALIPEYNLQYLRYHYGLEVPGNPHDAEGDVNVLVAVFDKLISIMMENGLSKEEAIKEMIEISSHPSLYKVFGFGKYKDKTLEEVAATDPGYLDWLLKQKLLSGEEDEDWIYTLKFYLGKLS